MFLWRAKELLEGGGELLKAEAELAGMRLQRMLVGLVLYGIVVIIGLTGLLALLSGLCIMLAQSQGWAISLLVVGGVVLVVTSVSAVVVSRLIAPRAPSEASGSLGTGDEPPQAEAAQAKERMADAMDDKPDGAKDNPLSGLDQLKDEAVDFAVRNPMVVGSAALLAISAIGPLRSVRLISRGIATAGLVGSLIDAIHPDPDQDEQPKSQDFQPRPTRQDQPSSSSSNGHMPNSAVTRTTQPDQT